MKRKIFQGGRRGQECVMLQKGSKITKSCSPNLIVRILGILDPTVSGEEEDTM
jgi:hypothetical protein